MSRTLVDSGIKWIGRIPEDWNIVKVNKLFFRRKEVNQSDNPIVLSLARSGVKVRDISTNEGQLAESYDNYHRVYIGDLMLNPMDLISGANCSMSEVEGVISPAYINLAKKEECNSKYYDYFFKNQYWVNAMFIHGKGVSFDNRWTLNAETIMDYKIPVPSVREQTKIADYLDRKCSKIDKVIEDNNKEIELLNEYRVSYIDNQYKNNACYKKIKFDVLVRNEKGTVNSGEKYIGLENIEGYTTNYIETNTDYSNSDGKKFYKGDLLINKLRPYLAKSYLAEFDGLCTGEIEVIRNFKGNMNYLKYFTISNRYLELVNSSTYGAKMPRANWNFIKNLQLPSISIEEQDKVVNNINKTISRINKVIEYRKKIIEKLEEYKKSLIYEVVTGKKEV